MIRRRTALALALPLTCLSGTACITETESGIGAAQGMRTEGVIVAGGVDMIWARTRSVIESMATAPITTRGIERSLRTEVNGTEVTAFVEPYDAYRTIVHVQSEDSALADRIRLRIMN